MTIEITNEMREYIEFINYSKKKDLIEQCKEQDICKSHRGISNCWVLRSNLFEYKFKLNPFHNKELLNIIKF